MPSGKKSKQRRRAAQVKPPPVRAKGAPARRQASPRVLAIAGGAMAIVAVAVVLAIVLGGRSSSIGPLPTNGSLATSLTGAADVNTMLKGISQHGETLGAAAAPVTMVEYIDLQCPFCQRFETQVMPDILSRYVRTGKLKVEARVLDFIGPDSSRGRNAMIAAGMQGKAFNFAQLLYDNQQTENTGWLNDAMVAQAAKSIPGLNPRQVFAVRDSASVKGEASAFDREAAADKVIGTPTIFVGKRGQTGKQVMLASPTDEPSVVQAIQAALSS